MPFVDRREPHEEAGRWVKGGMSKMKGSTIGGELVIQIKACYTI
jgi:hypothetical protein